MELTQTIEVFGQSVTITVRDMPPERRHLFGFADEVACEWQHSQLRRPDGNVCVKGWTPSPRGATIDRAMKIAMEIMAQYSPVALGRYAGPQFADGLYDQQRDARRDVFGS